MGVLNVTDVVAAVGPAIATRASVGVLVLSSDAGAPFIGEIAMVRKRSGRAEHVALQCPGCGAGRQVLLLDGEARLRCRGCVKSRTKHQSEHSLTSWKHHGGREHDRIMRLVAGRGLKVEGTYRRARRRVDELLLADADRMAALREKVDAAMVHADCVMAEKPMTEEEALSMLVVERLLMGMGPAMPGDI